MDIKNLLDERVVDPRPTPSNIANFFGLTYLLPSLSSSIA